MKTIRWGIIGAGRIASTFAAALKSMEYTKLTAIASRDLTRAEEFAERFQIKKAYGSYEELARDPAIDVVYIATPHTEHKMNSALCLTNKKAVLCEKPLTINYAETEYLMSLAKKQNVFLMEAMWTKFLPVTAVVKSWLAEKKIGELRHIRSSFGYSAAFDGSSRIYNPDTAGGALLDVGVYPIAYVVYLLEELPEQVVSSAVIGRSHVDEQNVISLRFPGGILADISSAVSADTGNDALIIGDRGRIFVPNFWKADKVERYDTNGQLVETYYLPHKKNGYEYEAEEVNRCLREGETESDTHPLSSTLEVMKIMDQIRGQWGLKYPQEEN
ncbi:MAG: Gfo/Idh/MocA family oxidoreductase [Lachnospiraceae bacterium]|jgi:predicted dehydrogenase|nr:Gfo/Idh/MocA family oxidoreductase [Lachnospiraceae bacterium]